MTKKFESPANFKCELLDENERLAIQLWLFCGLTQKKAYEFVYKPTCTPASLPPKVSLFFNSWFVRQYIRSLKEQFSDRPYLNPASYKY